MVTILCLARAPANDRCLNGGVCRHALPSAALPSAQEWNDIGADVILAQELKGLVRRRHAVMGESADSLLPCRHAILMIRAVETSMHPFRCTHFDATRWSTQPGGAATASQDAYITPIKAESTSERPMAFKPNYNQQRAERNRAKQAKRDEKRKLQEERTAQRKAQGLGPEPEDGAPEESEDKES